MGKQRRKKGQNPDQPDLAVGGIDAGAAHVPPLPQRIADQVADDGDDEDEDESAPQNASPSNEGASRKPSSATDVADEHRQSIASILKSLTGSTDRAPNGDDLSAKLQRELMGQVINNYEIVGVVSSGGMGDVFSAVHTVMGRKAAIKVLRPEHCGDPALVQRFFNEARAANSIRHPNIVEVLDVGILPAGLPYITMELLEGETLAERLRRLGRMDIDQSVSFTVQASNALQAAHRQGIVHRDLKPDNLFIVPDPRDSGRELIKILDFGIAKLHGDKLSKVKTNVGSILGTPPYMSPEQCRGIPDGVDHRSDVYALGVILFEMLCGAPPFVADGIGDVMVMHLSSPPPLPTWRRKEIPARIEQTILWALEKNPDQRIPSMADFAFALGVGPTPVPYLATPTGLTAPSFSGPSYAAPSLLPPMRNGASVPPPAFNMDATVADDRAPETSPPVDRSVTQYSPGHAPAVAAPSLPPPPVGEEISSKSHWLTSIAWASAAGLVIAAGGWFVSHNGADTTTKDERSLARVDNSEGRVQAPVLEIANPTIEPAASVLSEQLDERATASTSSSAAVVGESTPLLSTSSSATQVSAVPPGRGFGTPVSRNRWVPARTTPEPREVQAAQPQSNVQSQPAGPQVANPPQPAPGAHSPEQAIVTPGVPVGPADVAPAQKPQAAGMGLLNLAAAPWANVSLNGRNLGVTPLLNLRLPVGVHQLNLSNPELGRSTVISVEISADKPVSRFVGWHKTP